MSPAPRPHAPRRTWAGLIPAAALALCLAACQTPMSDVPYRPQPSNDTAMERLSKAVARYPGAPNIDREYTGTVADWPLFFIRHNFASDCFDTQYCRIAYGRYVSEDATPQPSIASFGKDYPSILTNSVSIGIQNFAGPIEITWRSKDGTPLEATIDFDVLFKDRLIPLPPTVKREDIPERIGIGHPTIVVEVVDRTVNVYTRTFIPMKAEQIPGNRLSRHNVDLVRVFTQTY